MRYNVYVCEYRDILCRERMAIFVEKGINGRGNWFEATGNIVTGMRYVTSDAPLTSREHTKTLVGTLAEENLDQLEAFCAAIRLLGPRSSVHSPEWDLALPERLGQQWVCCIVHSLWANGMLWQGPSMAPKKSIKATKRSSKTEIPAPFTSPPDSLAPFLARLDPAQVHITHVDRHRPEHKKSVFLIPVTLNAVIAVLLAWRLYIAVPKYWVLLQTLQGHVTTATVDPTSTTRAQQIRILLSRFAMFAFDFFLFRYVGPWPLTFFAEQPANPVLWRWRLGFLKEEVVVRVSRNWGSEELMRGVKQGEESPYFKTRLLPAIEPVFMQKTGYLMMSKDWDLEFELMLDVHTLAGRGEVQLEELDKLVLVHLDGSGWVVWRWESGVDVVEGRRKKVVAFKEVLTKMGKESLFWKWTEIVEEERDADGGFTPERQEKVVMKVKREFERNGVDFEEVVTGIGGLGEVPTPEHSKIGTS